jgi:hypothetical protein
MFSNFRHLRLKRAFRWQHQQERAELAELALASRSEQAGLGRPLEH